MTSIARKIRRYQGYRTEKSKVDILNDRLYQDAVNAGNSHFLYLHPTKGFGRVSFAKMKLASGGKLEMAQRIFSAIARAQQAYLRNG